MKPGNVEASMHATDARFHSDNELDQYLIGVVDLRQGKAVHAVAGDRARYQVIDQKGCTSGSPQELVHSYSAGLNGQTSAGGIYIADLDAIVDSSDESWNAIAAVVAQLADQNSVNPSRSVGGPIWLDRGVPTLDRCESLAVWNDLVPLHVVVGTESLKEIAHLDAVHQSLLQVGVGLTISIDLKHGMLQSDCTQLKGLNTCEVVTKFVDKGISQFIVLDLASVGTNRGPVTADCCNQLTSAFADSVAGFHLISGGGVRGEADARQLMLAGCGGILVASWFLRMWADTKLSRNASND